jgi:germacradienol/geosmin synthase
MSPNARAKLRKAVLDMTGSWQWELANHVLHRIPDPVDYIEMRRKTFGADLTMSLSRLAQEQAVPDEVFAGRPMRSLEDSAADFGSLVNDIFSYQKEIEFEGELHNGVLVVQRFLSCDRDRAVAVVNDLVAARVRQFERIAAHELPLLDLDAAARTALDAYVQGLRDWMAGLLAWHEATDRYTFRRTSTGKAARSVPALRRTGATAANR